VVAIGNGARGGVPSAGVDQDGGGVLATQHLLDAGHATVWHVAGPTGWLEADARAAAWQRTLNAAGADVPQPLTGDWSARSGYEAGRILAKISELTAIFAANDHMALGLLRAFAEAGRRVPEDVSLVGFDDIPEAGFFSPPLTTVRQDFDELGRQSLALLLDRIRLGSPLVERASVPARLIVRDSVAIRS
jgi:LacI family transcriptional regulator